MAAPKKLAVPEFRQKNDRLESLSHQKNLADLESLADPGAAITWWWRYC
jgi:hypothetical protein